MNYKGSGVLSNYQRWKLESDPSWHENGRYYNIETYPPTATGSRSDPISSVPNPTKMLYNRTPEIALAGNFNHNQNYESRKPACGFRGGESSSYTNGFSKPEDNDDEPTDILVWSTSTTESSQNTLRQNQRSLSDTKNMHSAPCKSKASTSLSRKSAVSNKSHATKLLNHSKPQIVENNDLRGVEYESQLVDVTKQLEMIRTTQDSILSELSDDISTLQYENIQLKNTNGHLTMQNSHLLQVINDLSNEVELLRQVFRNRGMTMNLIENPRNNAEDAETSTRQNLAITPTIKKKQRPKRHKERFDTIPLGDCPSLSLSGKNSYTSSVMSVPGDEQISALSNRSKQRNKNKFKENSRKETEKKSPKSGGCFKALFKRKKKHSHHHNSVNDEE